MDGLTMSPAARRAAPANTECKIHVCAHRGCGKAFNRPSHLERHARVHTGESIANATITSSRCLLHMCTCVHLDQADAQTFKQSSNLNTHTRVHTGGPTAASFFIRCSTAPLHPSHARPPL